MNDKHITTYFDRHQAAIDFVRAHLLQKVSHSAQMLVDTLHKGNKVLVMGNGGSAADAQHFAAEIVGRFTIERPGLPAVALTTDTSILTAIGNDYGFDAIFERQVEALATSGDLVIGLSTSGHSRNVYRALALAKERGCKTIGLLGKDGGDIASLVDMNLTVGVPWTPHIQEAHGAILHLLCSLLDEAVARGDEA